MSNDVDMEKNGEKEAVGTSSDGATIKSEKMFSLKRWNAVAMWSWDVECEICAICRVQVMGKSYISSTHSFQTTNHFFNREKQHLHG